MKSLSACIVVCFLSLAISCAPTRTIQQQVSFDYDVKVDFAKLKTYEWVSLPGTLRIDKFNRMRIQDVVNNELNAKGLRVTARDPDVFIVMFGGQTKEVDMTAMMDYEVYPVGRLKLAFYDAKSNKEIWWGETRADLLHNMTPEEKDITIALAVNKILDHYPPVP
ncbi:MAG: DUF4136 domain-containing protein [Deltaproteobacteria bacterium]|nr:DUF4136 domain-containing protein [Deltaproteobacteria bacterium]